MCLLTVQSADLNYQEASKDFVAAVKNISTTNKYIPTIAEIIETMKQVKQNREDKDANYVAVDTSNLTDEEYIMLVKKQITIKELIEKGKIHV